MNYKDPFLRPRLFCPGPTPIPSVVNAVTADAQIYHRTSEFYEVVSRCRKLLAPFMGTKQEPAILTASGSGAMEAAVVNLTAAKDRVIVVNGGKFGERWEQLCKAYDCDTAVLNVRYGESPAIKDLLELVEKHKGAKAIFLQANETSTGVFFPLSEIIPAVRKKFDGLIVVDAISALCAHEIKMDEWGIDAVVSGSQKGFGLPPGLAFISLSKRAWENISNRGRYYFDLRIEEKNQKEGKTAWTPAITLIQQLDAALQALHNFGLKKVFEHHALLARAARAGATAIGLELFPSGNFSHALTAIKVPKGVDGSGLIKLLQKEYQTTFAGGQGDELKGKIVRFAHLGFIDSLDFIGGMAAFEFGLLGSGYKFDLGDGVKAAMRTISGLDNKARS
jgi:aspartate aminotransferase-like enzyme